MDRSTLGAMIARATPVEPVVAVIVPEVELAALIAAARVIVTATGMFNDNFGAWHLIPPEKLRELERTIEPFAGLVE